MRVVARFTVHCFIPGKPAKGGQAVVENEVLSTHEQQANSTDHKDSDKKRKGIKQLLQESKAASHPHEKIPDSQLFLNTLKGPNDSLVSVELSSDDSTVVTASEDQVVRVYHMKGDFVNAKPSMTRIPMKETPIRAMFWGSSDHIAICTSGLGQGANLFAVKNVKHGRTIGPIEKLASSLHDGDVIVRSCSVPWTLGNTPLLATLTKTKEAKLFNGAGSMLASVQPSGISNYQVALSPDGRFLAVTTWACDMKLWEVKWSKGAACQVVRAMELKGHTSGITSVAFNSDTTRAVTASKDGTLRIWKLDVRYNLSEDPKCVLTVRLAGKPYDHLAWSPVGTIVGAQGPGLHFIDECTGSLIESVPEAHARPITGLCVSRGPVKCGKESKHVTLTCSKDNRVRLWSTPSPEG